jgi:hypothetical protein
VRFKEKLSLWLAGAGTIVGIPIRYQKRETWQEIMDRVDDETDWDDVSEKYRERLRGD